MKLVDNINKIEINDNNKYFLEELIQKYLEYIKIIENFDEKLFKHYLNTLKTNEILNNQQAEQEDSFLISLYNNMQRENSLDKIIKILSTKDDITKNELKLLHKILMKGTNNEVGSDDFRKTDTKFVGAFLNDGTKKIDYMPIPSIEINDNIDKTLEFINSKDINDPFTNPFIAHAIISVMQPFDDGNTRTSRLLQHGKIWKNTNNLFSKSFDKPIVYLSRNYLFTRGDYRKLLSYLAKEESNEAWNEWFRYNFNMLDEQLYYLNNNVKKLIK